MLHCAIKNLFSLLLPGCFLLSSCATKPPSETGNFYDSDLVELIKLDSSLKLDIRYATSNNLVGKPVYTEARAFLQRPAAEALVKVMQYARSQPWYNMFYKALPEFNNIKMKSGTMRDTKSFAGYHTAKDGKKYVFSIIINNYQGSGNAELQKILNVLK